MNLQIYSADNARLYKGIVWPNDQYEYDSEKSGEYTVCISLTDSMFSTSGYSQIKTQVKFASDFHRDRKDKKKGEEVYRKEPSTQEEESNGLKQGHFSPIRRRINKIYKKILEI